MAELPPGATRIAPELPPGATRIAPELPPGATRVAPPVPPVPFLDDSGRDLSAGSVEQDSEPPERSTSLLNQMFVPWVQTSVGKAATDAVNVLFEEPLGIPPETFGRVINQTPEDARGPLGFVRTFNEVVFRGSSQLADVAWRTLEAPFVGGFAALKQAMLDMGVSDDVAGEIVEESSLGLMFAGVAASGPGGAGAGARFRQGARDGLKTAVDRLPVAEQMRAYERGNRAFDEGVRAGEREIGASTDTVLPPLPGELLLTERAIPETPAALVEPVGRGSPGAQPGSGLTEPRFQQALTREVVTAAEALLTTGGVKRVKERLISDQVMELLETKRLSTEQIVAVVEENGATIEQFAHMFRDNARKSAQDLNALSMLSRRIDAMAESSGLKAERVAAETEKAAAEQRLTSLEDSLAGTVVRTPEEELVFAEGQLASAEKSAVDTLVAKKDVAEKELAVKEVERGAILTRDVLQAEKTLADRELSLAEAQLTAAEKLAANRVLAESDLTAARSALTETLNAEKALAEQNVKLAERELALAEKATAENLIAEKGRLERELGLAEGEFKKLVKSPAPRVKTTVDLARAAVVEAKSALAKINRLLAEKPKSGPAKVKAATDLSNARKAVIDARTKLAQVERSILNADAVKPAKVRIQSDVAKAKQAVEQAQAKLRKLTTNRVRPALEKIETELGKANREAAEAKRALAKIEKAISEKPKPRQSRARVESEIAKARRDVAKAKAKLEKIRASDVERELAALQEEAGFGPGDRAMHWYYKVDNVRRGLMVTNLATTARNATQQLGRIGIDTLQQGIDAGLRKLFLSEGVQKAHPTDAFGTYLNLFRVRGTKKKVDDILGAFPAEYDKMYSTFLSDFSSGMFGKAEKAVNFLNTINRFNEYVTRRAVFESKLSIEMAKRGKSLEDIVTRNAIGEIPRDAIKEALRHSLEMTFAKRFSQHGKLPERIAANFVRLVSDVPGLTVPIPFPNNLMNIVKFLYEFSPLPLTRLLSPAERAKVAAGDTAVISRATIGIGLFLTAYSIRNSDVAGEKWYEVKATDGRTVNLKSENPLSSYLFMADIVKRAREGTLSRLSAREVLEGVLATQMRAGTGVYVLDTAFEGLAGLDTSDKAKRAGQDLLGNYLSGFAVPLNMLSDIAAEFDESQRIIRSGREGPFVGPVNLGPVARNIPYVRDVLPETVSPLRAGPLLRESPLLRQFTGLAIQQAKSPVEKEVDRLGLERKEYFPSTGDPMADRMVATVMGPVVQQKLVPFVESAVYRNLDPAVQVYLLQQGIQAIRGAATEQVMRAEPSLAARLSLGRIPRREREFLKALNNSRFMELVDLFNDSGEK